MRWLLMLVLIAATSCRSKSEGPTPITNQDCQSIAEFTRRTNAEHAELKKALEQKNLAPAEVLKLLEAAVDRARQRLAEVRRLPITDPLLVPLVNESIRVASPLIPMMEATIKNLRGGHIESLTEQLEVVEEQLAKVEVADNKIIAHCNQ